MIPAIGSSLPRLDVGAAAGIAPSVSAPVVPQGGPQADFAAVMADVVGNARNSLAAAETVSVQGIQGGASTQAVVEAVMDAERTLQTAVALRDKVVTAYLEISRMAI